MSSELGRFLRGFGYAAQGLRLAVRQERNFRFHLCAAGYVLYGAARFYALSRAEWALLALTIAGVPALELVNSAVERAVDAPDAAHWAAAGAAKDLAAAGVLAMALGAVAVGLCLFWQPAVLAAIPPYYLGHPWELALLLASLPLAGGFVFYYGKYKNDTTKK